MSPTETCSFCERKLAGGALETRLTVGSMSIVSCADCTSKGISKVRTVLQKKTPLLFGLVSAYVGARKEG